MTNAIRRQDIGRVLFKSLIDFAGDQIRPYLPAKADDPEIHQLLDMLVRHAKESAEK